MRRWKRRRGERREWDGLHTDILFQIFSRISDAYLIDSVSCVSRSWRLGVVDTIFCSKIGGVLDLRRVLDGLRDFTFLHPTYLGLLQVCLNSHHNNFRSIHFPEMTLLDQKIIAYIAQRTPSVQYVDAGKTQDEGVIMALKHWKNLKGFKCWFYFLCAQQIPRIVNQLRIHCKSISYLCLFGRIRVKEASAIVNKLPNLKQLNLKGCSVSVEAFQILDGHKKLEKLNLIHTLFVDESKILNIFQGKSEKSWGVRRPLSGEGAKDWIEGMGGKVAGNKEYLRCKGRRCRKCSWAYLAKSRP